MRRSIFLVIILTLLGLNKVNAVANVKAGTPCKVINSSTISDGNRYTCIKSGKKLIWNKGILNLATPNQSGDPTLTYKWQSICSKDPWVPSEWAAYQDFELKTFGCNRPLRYVDVKKPNSKPKTLLTDKSERVSLNVCKIPRQPNNEVGHFINGFKFGGDVNIQIIPLEFNDFKASKSPSDDYKKYLTYIHDMYYKISDGNLRINFKVPDSYINTNKSLDSYSLPGEFHYLQFTWANVDIARYDREMFAIADKSIDFTGTDFTFVLVPPSVPAWYIPHSSEYRMDNMQSDEGLVRFNYLMPPATAVSFMSWFGAEPFLHLHKMMHANGLLGDHYGDDFGRSGPNVGTGNWGAMSGMQTDFLMWDKWISGMVPDSEFICVSPSVTSTNLVAPVEYYGSFEKAVVVPISQTKTLVVESHRRGGANFKLTNESFGALVYVVDTLDTHHGGGIRVIRAPGRTADIYSSSFILSDAPLKQGESITVEGYKITNVEFSTTGDVIKVEKI